MAFLTRRETPRPPMENLELLRTAADEVELSMIRGLLDENGIVYITRERDGAGTDTETDVWASREHPQALPDGMQYGHFGKLKPHGFGFLLSYMQIFQKSHIKSFFSCISKKMMIYYYLWYYGVNIGLLFLYRKEGVCNAKTLYHLLHFVRSYRACSRFSDAPAAPLAGRGTVHPA